MSTARVRLRFAQASFLAATAVVSIAAYTVLTEVVTVEQQDLDRPDADIELTPMWRLELGRVLTNISNIEDMQ